MSAKTIELSFAGHASESVRVGTLADRELVSELLRSSENESSPVGCLRCQNCGRKVWMSLSSGGRSPGLAQSEQSLPLRQGSGRVSSISSGWSAASLCSIAGSSPQDESCSAHAVHHVPSCRPVLDARYAASHGPLLSDDGKNVFCGMDCYWSATLDPKSIRTRLVLEKRKPRPVVSGKTGQRAPPSPDAHPFCRQQGPRRPLDAEVVAPEETKAAAAAVARHPKLLQARRTDPSKQMPWLTQQHRPWKELGINNETPVTAGMHRATERSPQAGDFQHAMYEHHAYFGGTFRRTVGIEPLRRYAWS
ncbi:hypothetical protein F1559_000400 [Cyanidiococcus yangmingshanensis]|uniref:Uncharacterized protein n=1 Tax=Cyanidiococcus yangmingshanensis TaxID=2690220 RepID=A0A7J7ICT7_9RHOD|nr:hypothetical protein F1559_000400 [Cyanidiococcus yangmingshanensis]